MNEFLEQFVLEARELAEQATADLLALEQSPQNKEALDSAFRAFHTLKGGAGIVDFAAMSRAVHAAEDALSSVRSGDAEIDGDLINDCLFCVDRIEQWLDEIDRTGDLPQSGDTAADAVLRRFADSAQVSQVGASRDAVRGDSKSELPDAVAAILREQILLIGELSDVGRHGRLVSVARVTAGALRYSGKDHEAAAIEASVPNIMKGDGAVALKAEIARALESAGQGAPATERGPDAGGRTLRVETARVENLVKLTGELIVSKNAIAHIGNLASTSDNPLAHVLKEELTRLERLTGELQYAVVSLRVLPLRGVFRRFVRVVREMAVDLEKPVKLLISGEDTEADKAVVEMLFEPLLHVVRNAMDHGIEPAAERAATGKPVVATVALSARREGERIVVEASDDGRGIEIEKVRQTALHRGAASADISGMTDRDVVNLIFTPGFSTAGAVSELSGRGVGMDSVRATIERLGGNVQIESRTGLGTTVRFVLPYSAMMTRVMTVEVGHQAFGIPLDTVVETVRIPRQSISAIGSAGAFVLRDRTIPLVDLGNVLERTSKAATDGEATIVVVSLGGQVGALEVERLGERMDVMLKPPEGLIAGIPGIAGTTLLGDGQVLIVLDIKELLG